MNDSYVHYSFDWWLATLGGFAFLHNSYASTQQSIGKYFSCLKKIYIKKTIKWNVARIVFMEQTLASICLSSHSWHW